MKVSLHKSALAKSHRPFRKLINPDRVSVVAGADLGQLIVEVTNEELQRMEGEIALAEPVTCTMVKPDGKRVPNPPPRRREVGVIDRFELYGPEDRRRFSATEAVALLQDPRRGGAYLVELFEFPPPQRAQWAQLPVRKRHLFESFESALRTLQYGLVVERLEETNLITPLLSVRLLADRPLRVSLAIEPTEETVENAPVQGRRGASLIDLRPERHAALLEILTTQTLVKSIGVAPLLKQASVGEPPPERPARLRIPDRPPNGRFPLIGVIDGGIADVLAPWVVGRWGLLAPDDRDLDHGTFIAGLLVAGSALNGAQVCAENDGCELVDIDVMPREDDPGVFAAYYPDGLKQLLEELENAVLACKQRYGVRVFCFSFNEDQVISAVTQGALAQHFDAMAETTGAIFVLSVGNLDGIERNEWDRDPLNAIRQLAMPRGDETVLRPAESTRNVAVGAVNPPGLLNSVADAPARYTRRGLRVGTGVKPEFAHYGGSGTTCPRRDSGLFSINSAGQVVAQAGTSYAVPLVAKTLACLDAAIEEDVPRETLLALLVHSARVRDPLTNRMFTGISRWLVGFGQLPSSDAMLAGDDYEITLLFHGVLHEGKAMRFPFRWPQSLVGPEQKCRGIARMTLVYSPPLDALYGAERVRVNLDARLQQDVGDGHWAGRAKETFLDTEEGASANEQNLIEHGLKWNPVKTYQTPAMRGKGASSTWQIAVDYVTRSLTAFPERGVPFTLIVTIRDHQDEIPIFDEVRRELGDIGVQLAPIQATVRARTRLG
ncbi:MAG TPA: S8 family serine peptidase [Candidatus Acidoferrales bacterium]|nr:S8 family serine peptidase [Candidatus Acidoferrales bacterium]